MRLAWRVFVKELVDALRDRRTLLAVVLSSVAVGPAMLVALSALLAGIEQRAEAREVHVVGIEHAPTLRNFLERQTYLIRVAPPDYEGLLVQRRYADPVLVVPEGFERDLARGVPPRLELVSASSNTRAESSVARIERLLQGFASEQATLRLAWRGLARGLVQVIEVEPRDLADPLARAARFTGLVPFFVLMAVVYGSLGAALDTTAGERERGSLEPLLVNPVPRGALVLGKWAAVASVAMGVAVLSCLSFLPGQWLLRSPTLAAMFRFDGREAALFLALLLPLAAAFAALLMAVAIRCRSVKEAQAATAVLLLAVALLPLVALFGEEGEQPWHLGVPGLAQMTLMGRVLKGEAIAASDVLLPLAVAAALTAVCLADVAGRLRRSAVR